MMTMMMMMMISFLQHNMKYIFIIISFLFLSFIQNDSLLIEFININDGTLNEDLISITVLDTVEQKEKYYNSKTYFTVEGYILLPYDKHGTNLIIGTCENSLYYYILPDVHRTSFLVGNCGYDN